ncbi:hypothetical protein ACET3Z_022835 [Daucus carota]
MTTTEMHVHIDCPGCEDKVRKALTNLKGVDSVDIDMEMQKVTVTGWTEQKKILKTVRKTGRRAEIWQLPYNPELRNSNYNLSGGQHMNHGGVAPYVTQQPVASSSYNYYKHGYSTSGHGTHSQYNHYSTSHSSAGSIFGHQTGAAFSDENPNACSVM